MPLIDPKRYENEDVIRQLPYADDWEKITNFLNALYNMEAEVNGKRCGKVIAGDTRAVLKMNVEGS